MIERNNRKRMETHGAKVATETVDGFFPFDPYLLEKLVLSAYLVRKYESVIDLIGSIPW